MRPDRPCQGAPPLQSTAHGSAACLTNRALGLDAPQLHPAPRACPSGRTNVRGIASASAPVVWATAQALGVYHPARTAAPPASTTRTSGAAPDQQPSTPVHHRPKPKPCPRIYRARGSLCKNQRKLWGKTPAIRAPDQDGQDASSPSRAAGHPSPNAHPAGHLRQRQDHGQRSRTSGRPYGKGNRPSHTTQPQATATSPPAYPTQRRAKAHSRQGNPPRTKSNSGAAALTNAPPLPPTAPSIGRAAGTPQGSEVARGADTMKTPP
ncbi:hypothetical protein WOLCODRAFT_159071 [Wolfiporia cocos MD-104 SS10]|uniref:Uncharacterized protein n=1 Tax=Wolfiporia cocos (strain MD-104) TaxID=742152 RepID=A0A2H3JL24_WOLCO|nr:hypothetical protein WOLCODRAFT_159071 [Wolfiporia cocos MD-104 SS10]